MKRFKLAIIFFLTLFVAHTRAESIPAGGAVEHMNALSEQEGNLSVKYMSYMSEVAHGGRARKMDKRRQEVIATLRTAISTGNRLRPFEGDASLRNAYVAYWNVLLSVFNEDYHKIVDMEEIAEQSYDDMEAYLMLQEKADEKVDEAYTKVIDAYNAFAAKHNVTLTEGQSSKLSRKLAQAGKVNGYVHKLFLVHFKSSVQENNMIGAMNKKDINGMEQNRGAMKGYAEEGLQKLDTMSNFKGDGSLITACRKTLEFQIAEASRVNLWADFLLKADEFEKSRKAFEAKPASKRTQADVDAYNNSVNVYNKTLGEYTKQSKELNEGRNKVHENWESAKKRFMDHHVPHK